uniref:DUF3782 domain-containing protein n=1 Tax=Candidatus Kentrum sp. FW TaxID=2126338 RepID=A0A450T6C8_9GAMM|nr:MAG: hypothetical protein BECKFW1821C_GA0114237_100219 [Candidatus Kentron sp. FW]
MTATANQPTYEEILHLFQEAHIRSQEDAERRTKETDRRMEETDRRMEETDRRMKETDRRIEENDRLIKETWIQIKETNRQRSQEAERRMEEIDRLKEENDRRKEENDRLKEENDRRKEENDRRKEENDRLIEETRMQIKETDRQMKETDRKILEMNRETSKKIGELGNRLGDFVQEMVRPAVVKLFQAQGIDVREVHPNVSVRRNGEGIEVDLFVVDDRQAIAVECKSHASADDIREHLERLSRFKDFFPRYRDVELMGAMAAMVMPDEVARYAYHQGLYVLTQSGETVKVRNDAAFKPKLW